VKTKSSEKLRIPTRTKSNPSSDEYTAEPKDQNKEFNLSMLEALPESFKNEQPDADSREWNSYGSEIDLMQNLAGTSLFPFLGWTLRFAQFESGQTP